MSLSTCTQKVRITSPNGNLLSEGEMECKNIATLKNLGYTIEELEEPKEPDYVSPPSLILPTPLTSEQIEQQEEELEQLQIQTEQQEAELQEVIIQEPLPQIFEIQEVDLINRGLEIATKNINLQSENQALQEQIQNLQNFINNWESNLPFKNEKEYHEFLLQKEIARVHSIISSTKSYVGNHPRPEGREIEFNKWSNSTSSMELSLEKFARDLGLTYTRRSKIDGEPFYYKTPAQIEMEEQKEWISYIPTSSAVVSDF